MNLKKLTAFLLVLALSLCVLAACKEENGTSSTPSPPTESNDDNDSSENTTSEDESNEGDESNDEDNTTEDDDNEIVDITMDSAALQVYNQASALLEDGNIEEACAILRTLKKYPEAKNLLANIKIVYTKSVYSFADMFFATEYTYDENGRLLKVLDVNSGSVQEEYAYNENGFLSSATIVDNEGMIRKYTYNENGKLIKEVREKDGVVYYDISFTYSSDGGYVKEEACVYNENFTSGWVRKYEYDDNGNLVKKESSGAVVDETYIYTYDAQGNLIKEEIELKNIDSYAIEYTYDKNGNLLKKILSGTVVLECTYDANGNLIKEAINDLAYGASTNKYTYDEKGNLIKTEEFDSSDTIIKTINYTYDTNGNLITEELSLAEKIEYSGYLYFYYPDGIPEIDMPDIYADSVV